MNATIFLWHQLIRGIFTGNDSTWTGLCCSSWHTVEVFPCCHWRCRHHPRIFFFRKTHGVSGCSLVVNALFTYHFVCVDVAPSMTSCIYSNNVFENVCVCSISIFNTVLFISVLKYCNWVGMFARWPTHVVHVAYACTDVDETTVILPWHACLLILSKTLHISRLSIIVLDRYGTREIEQRSRCSPHRWSFDLANSSSWWIAIRVICTVHIMVVECFNPDY